MVGFPELYPVSEGMFSPFEQKLARMIVELPEPEERVIGRILSELMIVRVDAVGEDALRHCFVGQYEGREKRLRFFVVNREYVIEHFWTPSRELPLG